MSANAVTHRCIVHADMDAFFASIEIRDQPQLRGLPVIVGGLSGRGVVCAASYEARKFGVRSALPTFRARELCPGAVFLSPNMEKYAQVSREIHTIFYEFTSQIEPIAFDEAYLDVTRSLSLFPSPLAIGQELKRRVYAETELVVSVGIGPSKLIAKIACSSGKPNGLVCVTPDQVAAVLEPLPVRRLWGIGQVTERALTGAGIHTVRDLRNAAPELLTRIFGTRAPDIVELAWGNDPREVEAERESRSIGEESTFEQDARQNDVLTAAITAHSESVAHRLRQLGLRAQTITLKLKLAKPRGRAPDRTSNVESAPDYPLLTRSRTLSQATSDGAKIREVALELLFNTTLKDAVRLLGVTASRFEKTESSQLELFPKSRKSDRLGEALDAITDRFGPGAIRRAVTSPDKLTPSQQQKAGEKPPKPKH